MVWYGMVWYGMVWHGMVWHGSLHCRHDHVFFARATCYVRVHASCNQVSARRIDGSSVSCDTNGHSLCSHGRDSGSYPHVQRAHVTVHVNAGVHRILVAKCRGETSGEGTCDLAFSLDVNFSLVEVG